MGGASGTKAVVAAGEAVVPAVVIFGNGTKKSLRTIMAALSPVANSAVISLHQSATGVPRMVAHCKENCLLLVQSLVPLLKQQTTTRAEVYVHQGGQQGSKISQVQAGLGTAARKAGVCDHFAAGRNCPFYDRTGKCNYHCWCGPPERRN